MLHSWRPLLAFAGLLALAAPAVRAQQPGTLTVTVTDAANQRPIEAARVFLVGTTIAGQTTPEGRLVLRPVNPGSYTVRILRVGYTEQSRPITIAAGQGATLSVALTAAAVNLAAVVTTATGEQRRVEIGNATANIDAAKVAEASPLGNLNDLLNSRAPGVTVTSGTQTGTGARIRIRGMNSISLNNEPIWIIDGIRMTSNNANFSTATGSGGGTGGNAPSRVGDINPEEIESIEIVKGPSAATLYGTDAANGVILVTTKKGRAGAARWSIYTEGGTLYDRNFYPDAYSLWGKRPNETVSSRAFCNLQRVGTGECRADSTSSLNIFDEPDLTPIKSSPRRQIGVQVSGGTEAVRYFVSAEDELEVGVLSLPEFERERFDSTGLRIYPWTSRPNQMGRRSLRSNVNATISPKFDLGMSTNFINVAQRYSLESNATAGLGSHVFGGPGTRNNGAVTGLGTPLNGYRAWTPGYMWQERTAQEVNRFLWSGQANYRPTSWLAARAAVGNDWTSRNDENLLQRGEGPPLTAITRFGSRGLNRVYINNLTVDAGATATYNFLGFQNKTTVGAQYIGFNSSSATTGSNQLAPGSQNVASGTQLTVDEATTRQKTFGAFIEQSLAWRDRLFLTAAVRSDQNSAFGTNFQSIVYPKASMSYLISEEDWWKAPSWVNTMRLRYAYGQSGVQPGPNDALRFYTAGITSVQNLDQPTITQAALGNANLRPERSAEHEMGFETQMLNQRLSLDFTYYSKITTDALYSAILPPSFGSVTSQLRNLASVKNAGIEVALNAQLVQRDAFGWDVNISSSANDNAVVSLGGTPPQIGTTTRIQTGYPVGGLWARPITGWQDKNGDGLLTYFTDAARNEVFVGDSAIFRGYSTPRYMTTLINGFDFFAKKLRVQTMWDWRSGGLWYNNTERIRCTRPNCSGRLNLNADFIDQATNIAANEHAARTLDGFFQSGAFVRLREASLQYTFSSDMAKRLVRGRSLSFVATARNLRLWTNYRGTDPESGFNTTSGTEAPSEFQTVGPPSYFIMRFNIGF
ncbi:MAG: SusC/RagA family TonB-linked outer membrane protein [Gemmatimonas sp.]|jgi:TonB-linked SusC/RagA family outer membrane protein|uniref:SusC/RagA family TonB-linked outer membrane protein n=3 Tax=Gemmatimonas sp. TaxID=1962908 RepID=UPI0022C38B65|nr:SusC/RagA family TonB-linked outer membrane protein [Gemmatimonas sp.]MCE2953653.1 SusC/RagA family TonB-linked outer membrane protein [Gemmatimonas sp.]MCZ8011917.1 SusC/RagA family TonB-linked outer membrane protein [Gemmatimonas sp.]MCZ8267235.1 SusC/RagA family TonB-linked outer membrane protein [Gemmatimonas sp.]